jgi:N-acetyl-gamma-glutamyl-phosphate reductase
MEQEIEKMAGHTIKIDFTPHLLPVSRGIFSTIYCKMTDTGKKDMEEDICDIYEEYYKDSLFVKFTGTTVPEMKDTVGTNLCMVGVKWDINTSTLKIFSTLDNLLKGASGQAVQNMNLLMGFDEGQGLDLNGIY